MSGTQRHCNEICTLWLGLCLTSLVQSKKFQPKSHHQGPNKRDFEQVLDLALNIDNKQKYANENDIKFNLCIPLMEKTILNLYT